MNKFILIFILLGLIGCNKSSTTIDLKNLDFLLIPECSNSATTNEDVITPMDYNLVSPVINSTDLVEWFYDGDLIASKTHVRKYFSKVNSKETHNLLLRITSKSGKVAEKNRVITVKPPLNKINIYAVEISIKGLQKFKYDNQLTDTTGLADVVPFIYNTKGDLITTGNAYYGNLPDCRDVLFNLKTPINNWSTNDPLIVKIFDYDEDTQTFQEITDPGFSQIITLNNLEFFEGNCEDRYPEAIDVNWVGPENYGCKQGLGVSLKIDWINE